MYPILKLKPKKEVSSFYHHPWIFSGALEFHETVPHGSLVHVVNVEGTCVGTGTFSSKSSIAVRLFAFEKTVLDLDWFVRRFTLCLAERQQMGYGVGTDTTGFRLVFGEADEVPGLVVDCYGTVVVVQLSTAGLDALRPVIVEALKKVLQPTAIIERSDVSVRREEGLEEVTQVLYGKDPGVVSFTEYGMPGVADVMHGQKTGYFLDQKETRRLIKKYAKGARVLNVCSYTGASSLAALLGGAVHVTNVDLSKSALDQARQYLMNAGFGDEHITSIQGDAFQYLAAEKGTYDLVIFDPPALIKTRKDEESGKKAYHFANRAAMRLVKDGGIFVTSSCSHFLSHEDFVFLLRKASVQADVHFKVYHHVTQSSDHPQSIYVPESSYLKTCIGRIEKK